MGTAPVELVYTVIMHGARGFTIIEFTIAIAVATILGAAAISRYNTYLREQEFLSGGQEVANCLQRANTQARAGATINPPRFVRATLAYDSTTPKVDCIVESQSQYRADGSAITVTQLLQGNPVESATNQPFRANNSRLASGTTVRYVFGALENGIPLGYSIDGVLFKQPDDPLTPSTYVPFGRGFSLTTTENVLRFNSASSSKCGTVQMTSIGTPVRFEELSTCS
jgi:prepilin-type N-terminal cleavage/methylation domain-containing protein